MLKSLSVTALLSAGVFACAGNGGMEFVPKVQLGFVEKPGQMEFTGKMIARPLQPAAWKRLGYSEFGAETQHVAAEIQLGSMVWGRIKETDMYLINVPSGETENTLAAKLMKTGLFEYVEPDWRVYPAFTPNDPQLGSQWSHSNNNSTSAWDIQRGSSNLIVGVTDTGIWYNHEDLLLNRVSGANTANGSVRTEASFGLSIVKDLHGHGTHCTGIADGNTNNGKGIAGVNIEGTKHMMVRVSDNSGGGSSIAALTLAMIWAAQNGARVVSTSYSGVQSSSVGTTGTQIKNDYNSLSCWAAGNDGGTYGAQYDWPDVTIVGAGQSNNTLAGFSARGVFLDVVAPGASILSTVWLNDGNTTSYATWDGTSMACPYAAGVATMILAQNPTYNTDRVRDVLNRSSINMGAASTYGWGRVNLWNAMGRKPNSMSVPVGTLTSGALADLNRVEGGMITLKPSAASIGNPPMQVATEHDVFAYAGNNYGEISIEVTAKSNVAGLVGQRIWIWNFTTSTWESLGTGSLGTTKGYFEGVKTLNAGNFADYIQAGKCRAKWGAGQTGPVAAPLSVSVDQITVRTLRLTE
ncbi:MAG: S8 family serine peptidase [Armatimonadetes bacterium]|nr:S8 family serine peptidase [Armatimonadota bacterium]